MLRRVLLNLIAGLLLATTAFAASAGVPRAAADETGASASSDDVGK